MKRALSCLLFCAVGLVPAASDARHRDGGGPGPRMEFGGRGDARGDGRGDARGDFGPPPFEMRHRPDQDRARDAMREGGRPLRDIQQQWQQGMPGYDYLGSDYNAGSGSYRLKFLRGGAVSWVEVDGRTGREIGRSPR